MRRSRLLATFVFLVTSIASTGVGAEIQAWDQAKVTALSAELVEKTRALRDSLRRQAPPGLSQGGRSSFHRLRDELGAIQATARRLNTALTAGETREETYPTYRRMIRSVRSAADELNRIDLGEPAASNLEAAASVLRKLRAFYEEAPPV